MTADVSRRLTYQQLIGGDVALILIYPTSFSSGKPYNLFLLHVVPSQEVSALMASQPKAIAQTHAESL